MKGWRRFRVVRVYDTWASAWPRCHSWDVVDRKTGKTIAQGFATRRAAQEYAHVRESEEIIAQLRR